MMVCKNVTKPPISVGKTPEIPQLELEVKPGNAIAKCRRACQLFPDTKNALATWLIARKVAI